VLLSNNSAQRPSPTQTSDPTSPLQQTHLPCILIQYLSLGNCLQILFERHGLSPLHSIYQAFVPITTSPFLPLGDVGAEFGIDNEYRDKSFLAGGGKVSAVANTPGVTGPENVCQTPRVVGSTRNPVDEPERKVGAHCITSLLNGFTKPRWPK
jgi:hypothetical protein